MILKKLYRFRERKRKKYANSQEQYMLEIKNIHAKIDEKSILKGINLDIKAGEVHAIMGPNGSGKSTLASVIAGRKYEIERGLYPFQWGRH